MRLMVLSLVGGLFFMPLSAMAVESDEFGTPMFTNETPDALSNDVGDDILSQDANLLGSIEPAAGEPSVLDDGWMPATTEERRLAIPENPVVPGMDETPTE